METGACWAWLDLYRERRSPEFTAWETRVLERVAARFAEAVRVSLLLDEAGPLRAPADQAGMVLLGPGCEIVSKDEVAGRWLSEIASPSDAGAPVPLAVQAVAARARRRIDIRSPGPARVRVRTRSGRWLVLHAFTPVGRPEVEFAVVVEPAAPIELAEMQVAAFDLTATERRVLQLTLQGLSTKEIAAALRISPYTARDHLSHVFDKTGARSRAQLFALLFAARPAGDAPPTPRGPAPAGR